MREENPNAPFGELSRLIGERWRALDADQKKEYEDKAKAKVKNKKNLNNRKNLQFQIIKIDRNLRSEKINIVKKVTNSNLAKSSNF